MDTTKIIRYTDNQRDAELLGIATIRKLKICHAK